MKIFNKYDHPTKGAVTFGRETVLRVNKAFYENGAEHKPEPIHYHKKSVQTFVVITGTLHLEVEGNKIDLDPEIIIEISPKERYKTLGHTGDTHVVVIGTHNVEGDRVEVS